MYNKSSNSQLKLVFKTNKTMEIIKNELGLFELHIDGELCVVKSTKKEILNFIKETNIN